MRKIKLGFERFTGSADGFSRRRKIDLPKRSGSRFFDLLEKKCYKNFEKK